MISLPRLIIAAPASGHGKTTVATGLMAALRLAGHCVSGHKVGPDYIDPGYHALATGRPGRNLDAHLVGEDLLTPLLLHGAAGADMAVIEGVMGLFDGQMGSEGFASTAHVADLTSTPVVLVVDISHASRTIAAVVHGLRTWSPDVHVAGVILNKAGTPRHADEVRRALAAIPEVPVLGVLHRDDGITAPSRHLGLVPADEREDAARALERLAAQVAEHVDLEAIVRLARAAPDLAGEAWSPQAAIGACAGGVSGCGGGTVAVAGGRAFTFRYTETAELLAAAGCGIAAFDPLTDAALPEGTTGLYLGGGFPELHTDELSANRPLLEDVRQQVLTGMPTVAECAGLLYLCRSVRGPTGDPALMAGVLESDAAMSPRLRLGYRTASARHDDLLSRAGETVTAHEFHRTSLTTEPAGRPAWWLPDQVPAGVASSSLHASYLHVHWAGHPHLARRFAAAAHDHHNRSATGGLVQQRISRASPAPAPAP